MRTSESVSSDIKDTPLRGWLVILLFRLQESSIVLNSFTLGLFLPFITVDLKLSSLEAGLLQGIWWITSATLMLPFGTWFSRFRPVPLVTISLILLVPFIFFQGLAGSFLALFTIRFFLVLFRTFTAPVQSMILQQWAARKHYALINSFGLAQHSILLAIVVSASAMAITFIGSWQTTYFLIGLFLLLQLVIWMIVAKERHAPVKDLQRALAAQTGTPLKAIRVYPQAWLLGITMFGLGATWTAVVTFLPTFILEERQIPLTLSGPILGFLYYSLIPSALVGGVFAGKVKNRKLLLWLPALLNMLFGIGVAIFPNQILIICFIAGIGMVWMASPAIQVLPFEFPGITPREVSVVNSLVRTCMGLGFAAGPVVTGLVAEISGSLQMGLIVMSLMTGVGVLSGLLYPNTASHIDSNTAK